MIQEIDFSGATRRTKNRMQVGRRKRVAPYNLNSLLFLNAAVLYEDAHLQRSCKEANEVAAGPSTYGSWSRYITSLNYYYTILKDKTSITAVK